MLREERQQDDNLFQSTSFEEEWSRWELVMGSNKTTDRTIRRVGIGYYRDNLTYFEDRCGIYELAFGHRVDYLTVVYVGCTCRKKQGKVLARLREYCTNGDHKAELIDEKLKEGFYIYFRARYVRENVGDQDQKARDAENFLLKQFDYAWNKRNNGDIRRI